MSVLDSWILVISLMGLAIIIAEMADLLFLNHIFRKLNGVKNGRITNQATPFSDSELKRKSENRFKRSFFISQ